MLPESLCRWAEFSEGYKISEKVKQGGLLAPEGFLTVNRWFTEDVIVPLGSEGLQSSSSLGAHCVNACST